MATMQQLKDLTEQRIDDFGREAALTAVDIGNLKKMFPSSAFDVEREAANIARGSGPIGTQENLRAMRPYHAMENDNEKLARALRKEFTDACHLITNPTVQKDLIRAADAVLDALTIVNGTGHLAMRDAYAARGQDVDQAIAASRTTVGGPP